MEIIKKLKDTVNHLYQDHLYRNSFYLILSNVIVGITGFLFWLIAARFYSPEDVGLAVALISAMTLFMVFSASGFNPAFIKFLPSMSSEERNELISTLFLFSIIISAILYFVFILFIDFFAPKLYILTSPEYSLIFIFSVIFLDIFLLMNGIFTSNRKSDFLFVKNTIQGISRLIFLPFFVFVGVMGIFISTTISLVIALFFSLFLLLRIYPTLRICFNMKILKNAFAFISANYISTIFLQLPNLLFPIIILNALSEADVAYFYIPWQLFFVFFVIITVINSAFLMEGSHDERDIEKHKRKTIKLSFLVVFGGIILFFIFGEFLLSLFGKEYIDSTNLLYVLAISLIPLVINQIYLTIKLIKKGVKEFTVLSVIIYSSSLIIGTILIPYFGIIGVGYGWLIGQMIGVVWIVVKKFR